MMMDAMKVPVPVEGSGASPSPEGLEERSDEGPAGEGAPLAMPDPEILEKAYRRRFSADYKLRILEEADACEAPGEVGRLLRREGLYSSHLAAWRKARRQGSLAGLSKRRGPKGNPTNPLARKVEKLERENRRLEEDLRKAHVILDVQGKVAGLLGLSFDDGKTS
jgi:transposase-like protein